MHPESRRDIPKSEKPPVDPADDGSIDVSFDDTEELTDADILESVEKGEGGPDRREAPESKREREKKERQPLLEALQAKGLDAQASLEIIAAYDPAMLEDEQFAGELDSIASAYGVKLEGVPAGDRDKLAVMLLGAKNSKLDSSRVNISEAMEKGIQEQLVGQAFRNIDSLHDGLEVEGGDPEKLKGELSEIMGTLNALSKQIPRDQEGSEATWRNIYNRFNLLSSTKRSGQLKPEINKAFSEIFDQFSDFIEDDMVAHRMKSGNSQSIEHLTKELYGRSSEEMEQLKERNREAVAGEIKKMADAPTIEISMLEELHALNNKGIVPKEYSKMRDNPDQIVTFNKRLGLIADDIRPEMEKMLERANDLYDKSIIENTSKMRYEIEAAKLHNDLLDMHPFGDRNGSTSLLFLELMMAKKGFEPPKTREKDYYKNLANIVGYNPVAVAVVGHEQYKIANEPGYYGATSLPAEKKKIYDAVMNLSGLNDKGKKKGKS
jgi:hypothetical protein